MDLSNLLKGFAIGISIAAPVGPIGVLCIRRTLASGWLIGLLTGLGAATADALYGAIAAFGLTFVSSFLVHQQVWLRLVGGAFLCYLGIKTFVSKPVNLTNQPKPTSLLNAFASTFFLTLTNPVTILAFAAIFAGIGLETAPRGYQSAGFMVLGVFLGSGSWWLILSFVASLFKNRISLNGLLWINRLSGLIILGFGIVALISGARLFRFG